MLGYGAKLARGCMSGQALIRRSSIKSWKLGIYDDGFCRRICRSLFYEEAMDMNAPFFKFEYFNSDVSLIIAFVIGIAFGIALRTRRIRQSNNSCCTILLYKYAST
ncbi:MAG: hypothetical protein MZV64_07855 [Ignavibacteriales bacterium]|nr:hypothetical protein [Ignavibacteriales bacterium]